MNFSKKLLVLFLLLFIPVFGINSFNVVNNKQNQILSDYKMNVGLPYLDVKIIDDFESKTLTETYDIQKATATQQITIKYSTGGKSLEDFAELILLIDGKTFKDIKPDSVYDNKDESENYFYHFDFEMNDLTLGNDYEYVFELVGTLNNVEHDSALSNQSTYSFTIDDPYVEPTTTINVSSIEAKSLHLDFKLTNDDWITIPNGITLNLYKKVGTESSGELVKQFELINSDKSNYYADLKGLESNTDYYINGNVNFDKRTRPDDDESKNKSIEISNYDFKTLKPWYTRTSGIIWISSTILLLLLLIAIMVIIWYFVFYRVKVKEKNKLKKDLNF